MSNPVDVSSLRSQIVELRAVEESSQLCLQEEESEKLRNDVASQLQTKFDQIFSEWSLTLSSTPAECLDEFLLHLKKEEGEVERENENVEREIEELMARYSEDCNRLECELENLRCSLESIESQHFEKGSDDMQIDVLCSEESGVMDSNVSKFKMLELSNQIEQNKTTLKSLQDLDSIVKRIEAVEKYEDELAGHKLIETEGDSFRLSVKTYIPHLETVLRQQDIEGLIEPLELDHELIIGTVDGTWELKSIEIFPNDVYIGDIIEAAKSFRQLYPTLSIFETRSSLEWFVRRVQEKVALSSLRRIIIKSANKSRHSFEYLDKEDTIVAHVVGGVDAFIKLPHGWPLMDLPLELISLKNTNQYTKEISLSFLCKIVKMANSLNSNLRQKISDFTDSIETILMKQMQEELNPDSISSN